MAWTRSLAAVAGAGLVLVVGWPIRENRKPFDRRRDDFPLSYYPMFSERRGAVGTVHHLIGVDPAGRERVVPHTFAGSGGLNQVRRQINRRVREGRSDTLARRVARRVAGSDDPRVSDLVRVRVVTSRHRYDDFFAGRRAPLSRRVHAEAPVRRPADPDCSD